VLTSWNGLMASALAQAYQVLGEPRYLIAAERCMSYLLEQLRRPDGRLFATARAGRVQHNAVLDDYAFVIAAAIDLYESSFDPRWLREAFALSEIVEAQFSDDANGGYFTTGVDHEQLLARLQSVHDGALPSGLAVHALSLFRLAALSGRPDLGARARRALDAQGALAARFPEAFGHLLLALDFHLAPPREVVISGEAGHPGADALLATVRSSYSPQRVVVRADAHTDLTLVPLAADKPQGPTGARAYVCRDFACGMPVDTPDALARLLVSGA
jgi:uncharacterized protein YyaL (SSP411 family)